jgi:hypothetical protein
MARDLVVRHFRQIVLWPFQLMPVRTGQVQRHWEVLEGLGSDCPWSEVADEFCEDPREFQERHYREFVTFLPYTQRFLYGSSVGQEASRQMAGRASTRTGTATSAPRGSRSSPAGRPGRFASRTST